MFGFSIVLSLPYLLVKGEEKSEEKKGDWTLSGRRHVAIAFEDRTALEEVYDQVSDRSLILSS